MGGGVLDGTGAASELGQFADTTDQPPSKPVRAEGAGSLKSAYWGARVLATPSKCRTDHRTRVRL